MYSVITTIPGAPLPPEAAPPPSDEPPQPPAPYAVLGALAPFMGAPPVDTALDTDPPKYELPPDPPIAASPAPMEYAIPVTS